MRSFRKLGLAGAGCALTAGALMFVFGPRLAAQEDKRPVFRVKVDMVVLSFTVTDSKGRYINGLKPKDFKITEDGISQKLATFAEGNKPPVQIAEDGSVKPGRALLAAMAAVVTTALERIHFVDVAHASTLRWQTEQQRSAILATLSHDLRTPLTVLFGLADSLAHDGRLTPEDHARVLQLRDQSHGLHRLVDNLLDLARFRSGGKRQDR